MKLADVSIKRPVLATVMILVLVVFGATSYKKIGLDLMPNIEFPFAMVTAVYPGADPETIETKVVDKIEEAVSTVSGIKLLKSSSMENVGVVFIQFELERNSEQAIQDVRDKVNGVLRELPADLEPPTVEKFDINSSPIYMLALSGPKTTRELTDIADNVVKQELQSIIGVGNVEIVGGQDREFHVWIDPSRLESYWLAASDVLQALAAQNVDIPGGRLDVGGREFTVKTHGQVKTKEEIEQIVITAAMGNPVRIGDVARVEDGEEELRTYSAFKGKSAVALMVRKQSGTNTVAVADAVTKAIAERVTPRLPAGVTIEVPVDNSEFIRQSNSAVIEDLILGGALAILIILFFLHDWRATFISALALPTSVIATFAFIKFMGFTFNTLTLLGLSLSIGILIDDAIVVIENIYRHLEMGKKPLQAASEATDEIGLAVMATTASIIAVFVPIATMKGIVGRFFLQFGLTVAFAVTVSLFVAFTLTPMLSARMLKPHTGKGPIGRFIEGMLRGVERGYKAILGAALRHRVITVSIAIAAFVGSLALAKKVPFEMMPQMDRSQFSVKIELPTGTAFDKSRVYVEGVAAEIAQVPGVMSTFVTVGSGGAGGQGEANMAEIQVKLVPKKERGFTQKAAMSYVRALCDRHQDAVFSVEELQLVGGGSAMKSTAIQFVIQGRDYDELNRAANALAAEMRKTPGYVDVDVSYRGGKPEYSITIDRDRAADQNVPVALIAMTVRSLIAGDKATDLTSNGDRVDVRVKLDEQFRKRKEDILALKVRSTTGQLVQLGTMVDIKEGSGPGKIEREQRQREVTVFANLDGKVLGTATGEIDAMAAKVIPASLHTRWSGMADIMKESFANLFGALFLAVIIVYLVLAAQFESWLHPLSIMMSLPLSLVGAIGALYIAKSPLGMIAMIGVILLMGLVTKNAILLVDYANTLRDQGMERHEALLAAGPVRLRPILMTTAAMVFGMIPIALGISAGGEMRAPMAVCVIGGLIASTLLTLVVVPVTYSLIDDVSEKVLGKRHVDRLSKTEPAKATE
jgi:hydrophobic/amphiphilic exporter-1 (mainly G- bacteria), HAE1 family